MPGGAKLKALIDDYEDVLGTRSYETLNVGGSNAGLNGYLERKRGEDFSLLTDATRFYAEIAAIDKQRRLLLGSAGMEVPLGYRASLADRAGDERSKHLYPGWLWDTAVRHAKGDPNRAMRLIGFCGHDDVSQGMPKFDFENKDQQRAIREAKLQAMLAEQASLSRLIERAENDPTSLGLNSRRRDKVLPELRNALILTEIAAVAAAENDQGGMPYSCPGRDSSMYLPQSLGKNVKISADLSQRIMWEQARGDYVKGLRRGEMLPGKSYHIYGGALVTCEMIARGYAPSLVKYLQGWIAWAYRTQRMSIDLRHPFHSGRDLKDPLRKPMPEMSDAEWKALWESETNEAQSQQKSFRNAVTNHLQSLRSTFLAAKREPAKAPWAKVDQSTSGYDYDRLLDLEKAFAAYLANPKQSPYSPPLSYDAFRDQVRAEHEARMVTAIGFGLGGGPFKENVRAGYRDYLYRVREIEKVWREVQAEPEPKFDPESAFTMQENRFHRALPYDVRNTASGQAFATPEEFKRARLEMWHEDPAYRSAYLNPSTKADAAYLMEKTTLSGPRTLAGQKIKLPYTDFGFPFPNAIRDTPLEHMLSPQPESWTNDRYDRAREMVKSWLVDWEWTVAQHEAGAAFAAKNCRPAKKAAKAAAEAAPTEIAPTSGSAR